MDVKIEYVCTRFGHYSDKKKFKFQFTYSLHQSQGLMIDLFHLHVMIQGEYVITMSYVCGNQMTQPSRNLWSTVECPNI